MKLVDVNVVIAAHRDDHPEHGAASAWLGATREGGEPFCVPDLVAGSFVRIVTNHRVPGGATPRSAALAFLRAVHASPTHAHLAPGARYWQLFGRLCEEADATGDLVHDALLAALALEHGAEVVSFDRDFARFQSVRWSLPA